MHHSGVEGIHNNALAFFPSGISLPRPISWWAQMVAVSDVTADDATALPMRMVARAVALLVGAVAAAPVAVAVAVVLTANLPP
jgi:hypothetical protein